MNKEFKTLKHFCQAQMQHKCSLINSFSGTVFLMAENDKKKGRIPPNSKESEMMVLGCMLTNVNSLNVVADTLHDLDFYYTEHQIIYSALKAAYRADKPADIHLIGEELKRQNKLEAIGGISYLTALAQYAGTSAFIEEYVQLVREKSILRQMVTTAQGIEKTALEEPADVLAALDHAQSQFFQISQENQRGGGILIKDLLTGLKAESKLPYLKELQERQQTYQEKGPGESKITGISTHFIDLDKLLNGFNRSNLMILAARPAMGKTALATCLAENICFRNHIPVGIFSLEMSATQILHRIISSQSEVESEKIQTGSLSGSEYQRIVSAVNMMQKEVLIIDDQPGLKITDIRARARRMKEAFNIGFLVIDYLQLISGSGTMRSIENRQIEISEISRMLKNLARELNIPVLCAAQLSRKVEERQGHRPMMSDLRESGSIENEADIVMMLFRRDYYDKYDKPGMAEVIIAKNRHGPIGDVQLTFRKEIGQFANYSPVHAQTDRIQSHKGAFSQFSPDDN